MLDNTNFMDNLNAKWNIEQVNIIFDRFHAVFLNWIPKSWLSFWTILHRRTDFSIYYSLYYSLGAYTRRQINQDRMIFGDISVEILQRPFSIQILTAVKISQNYI